MSRWSGGKEAVGCQRRQCWDKPKPAAAAAAAAVEGPTCRRGLGIEDGGGDGY